MAPTTEPYPTSITRKKKIQFFQKFWKQSGKKTLALLGSNAFSCVLISFIECLALEFGMVQWLYFAKF